MDSKSVSSSLNNNKFEPNRIVEKNLTIEKLFLMIPMIIIIIYSQLESNDFKQ